MEIKLDAYILIAPRATEVDTTRDEVTDVPGTVCPPTVKVLDLMQVPPGKSFIVEYPSTLSMCHPVTVFGEDVDVLPQLPIGV